MNLISPEQFLKERVNSLQNISKHFYIQMHLHKSEKEFSPIGSGFLIEYSNRFYILTAGHVATQIIENEPFGPLVHDSLVNLEGRTHLFGFHKEGRANFQDKDCAILPLDEEVVGILKEQFKFYRVNPTELTHSKYNGKTYFVSGASFKSTGITYDLSEYRAELMNIRTYEQPAEVYEKTRTNRDTHILLVHDEKKLVDVLTDKKLTMKDPHGLSGSPIWFIPNLLTPSITEENLKLCGILTYWDKGSKSFVGNRIGNLKEIIDTINEHDLNDGGA